MDPDRGGCVVADAGWLAGFLDSVVVVPGAFDGAGTVAFAAVGDQEFGDVFQEIQKMDFSKLPQGPELEERLRRQVMPNIESLELMLRRKLEEQRGGQVRNAASERPPDGYAEKVADYFRRLSKGK